MKSLFENLITQIILVFILFTLSSFTIANMQVIGARRVHSSIIDQLEASYFTIDEATFNEELHETYPNWTVTIDEVKTYNTRKEYRVTLVYEVIVPMYASRKTGIIEGYAR